MVGRLLNVGGSCYAPVMVGSQKHLWLLQGVQTLRLYHI
uniref:Similar to GRV2 (KATAMARI2) n=1 Tax=Arundo donax TaxID=35708 RepID=A0A0A9EXP4_ARUDO